MLVGEIGGGPLGPDLGGEKYRPSEVANLEHFEIVSKSFIPSALLDKKQVSIDGVLSRVTLKC
jgi:hypothetical protein